jgi:hypothetical protein
VRPCGVVEIDATSTQRARSLCCRARHWRLLSQARFDLFRFLLQRLTFLARELGNQRLDERAVYVSQPEVVASIIKEAAKQFSQ